MRERLETQTHLNTGVSHIGTVSCSMFVKSLTHTENVVAWNKWISVEEKVEQRGLARGGGGGGGGGEREKERKRERERKKERRKEERESERERKRERERESCT